VSATGLGDALDAAITGRGLVEAEDAAGRRVRADVKDEDRLGVQVERLRVEAPGAIGERVDRIAQDLRPGGERLVPVEVDERLGGGVLRSRADEMRGRRYFEVEVDGDGAGLGRYRVGDDGSRNPEPFTVTREQLGRMVDTLAGPAPDPDDD
jgi:hypothetical protein